MDKVLSESADFESLQTAHAKFLGAITRQCLLHVRTVRNTLDQVMSACDRLCSVISAYDKDPSSCEATAVDELDAEYAQHSSYLFLVLSGISEKLLLRLDFNSHFSDSASALGAAAHLPSA